MSLTEFKELTYRDIDIYIKNYNKINEIPEKENRDENILNDKQKTMDFFS